MPSATMQAMVLDRVGTPLRAAELPVPAPSANQVLIKVTACGVCRTDLHILDGELTQPKLPLVLGHEIIGRVEVLGDGVEGLAQGRASGYHGSAIPTALAPIVATAAKISATTPRFTGYQIDGGYAQYTVADARYVFLIPESYGDAEAAPLLCAGLIGYRSLKLAGPGKRLGIYGFGAAAHIVAQVARHQGREIYAFTRGGDAKAQAFALQPGRGVGRRLRRKAAASRWMRQSSSRPSARSSQRRSGPSAKAAWWYAAASI